MPVRLIAVGAEARLYLRENRKTRRKVLIKKREPKKYRASKLDIMLRSSRNRHEIRLLRKAGEAGVAVPPVLREGKYFFEMEFVEGKKLRDVLKKENAVRYGGELGGMVARLHNAGIIHGDLTTSNVIVRREDGKLVLIDFGLGFFSTSAEDMATDVHVLEETTLATHPEEEEAFMKAFLSAYFSGLENKREEIVRKRLESIRKRGRYVRKDVRTN